MYVLYDTVNLKFSHFSIFYSIFCTDTSWFSVILTILNFSLGIGQLAHLATRLCCVIWGCFPFIPEAEVHLIWKASIHSLGLCLLLLEMGVQWRRHPRAPPLPWESPFSQCCPRFPGLNFILSALPPKDASLPQLLTTPNLTMEGKSGYLKIF